MSSEAPLIPSAPLVSEPNFLDKVRDFVGLDPSKKRQLEIINQKLLQLTHKIIRHTTYQLKYQENTRPWQESEFWLDIFTSDYIEQRELYHELTKTPYVNPIRDIQSMGSIRRQRVLEREKKAEEIKTLITRQSNEIKRLNNLNQKLQDEIADLKLRLTHII